MVIDNIFSSATFWEAICYDITATISDHLSPSLIISKMLSNHPSKCDEENISVDYFLIDLDEFLTIIEKNLDYSPEIFLNKIYALFDTCALLKKISKIKLKFALDNVWLHKSISVNNKLLYKFISKVKDSSRKNEFIEKYISYRDL